MVMCKELISIEYKLQQNYSDGKNKLINSTIFKNKRKKKSFHLFNNFKLGKEMVSFLLIINLFQETIENTKRNIISHDSFIILKVNKIGTVNFYSCNELCFGEPPDLEEVYINNNKLDQIVTSYDFDEVDGTVKLLWKNNIESTQCMFSGCSDITEINLSDFDASQVTDMCCMFQSCSSLISINFSNLNTKNINDIQGLFDSCSSLTSLDLSNFETSKVTSMSGIFFGCSALISLD